MLCVSIWKILRKEDYFSQPSYVGYSHFVSIQSREETVYKLQAEVKIAAERLQFLLDHATLTEEDFKLNIQTFNWPGRMEPIFEVSQTRLISRREKASRELRERRNQFVVELSSYQVEVDKYQEKEVPRGLEEIQKVAEELADLGALLEKANEELLAINNEEQLLEWEITPYPQIQNLQHLKEPYDRLWNTVVSYHDKYHQWMNGTYVHTCVQ